MSKTTVVSRGIGFGGLLTLVFVAAKLWDKIDWSWWWVCSPLWIEVAAVVGVLAVVMLCAGLLWVVASIAEGVQRKVRRARKLNAVRK